MSFYISMVNDFMQSAYTQSGYGLFHGIDAVSEMAQNLGKNAIRGFERYQTVPPLFFQCLQKIGLIDLTADVPTQGVNLQHVETILKAAGLWKRKRLSHEDYFECGLHIQSGTQAHIWHRIMNQVRPKARTAAPIM